MEKAKNLLKFFLGVPLTIISFFFIGKFIYGSREQLIKNFSDFEPIGIMVGVICFLLFFFFRSLLWKEVLEKEGYKPSTMESIYLLTMSELRRYIPGSVLAIVGRVNAFRAFKIPSQKILKMVFFESVLFLFASILLAIPAVIYLLARARYDFGLILLLSLVIISSITTLLTIFRRRAKEILIELPKYIKAFLLICTAWIFYGIGNYLILNAFYSLDPAFVVAYSSFFVLAWLVGYATVIMPLGLGVREGFLAYELSFSVPLGIAAGLSVLSRIAFVVCEVLFVGIVYLIHKHFRPRPKITAGNAILWGIICTYFAYFIYINNLSSTNITNKFMGLITTFIIISGAVFIYKKGIKILHDKTLSIIFVASYLLNPFIQHYNIHGINFQIILELAIIVGGYIFIQFLISKVLALKIKYLDLKFFCVLILLLSIIVSYYYGILPGAHSPYLTPFE